jgi:hypothetical protein
MKPIVSRIQSPYFTKHYYRYMYVDDDEHTLLVNRCMYVDDEHTLLVNSFAPTGF